MTFMCYCHSIVKSQAGKDTQSEGKTSKTGNARSGVPWFWLVGVRFAYCLLTLVIAAVRGQALDPRFPPGHNFDLSHWYLTLPDAVASTLSPAQLTAGMTNDYFETGADGAMVFWCPVTGGTTSGSDFPRSELRELLDPTDNGVNWPGYGRHVLNAECRVLKLPSSRRVVIGQIHSYLGGAPPLVKLSYNAGAVEALVRLDSASSSDARLPLTNVGLSNAINYQITLMDGILSIAVNGATLTTNVFLADQAWEQQTFYFKAGNYCQDNAGSTNEGSIVAFYSLNIQHRSPSSIVISNATASAASFCLWWSSLPGSLYSIQGATSIGTTNWLTVSPNLEATSDSTSYCLGLPSPYHFFRVVLTSP
jgi:hypothetical protein